MKGVIPLKESEFTDILRRVDRMCLLGMRKAGTKDN